MDPSETRSGLEATLRHSPSRPMHALTEIEHEVERIREAISAGDAYQARLRIREARTLLGVVDSHLSPHAPPPP